MPARNSTTNPLRNKPAKPRPDFPLTAHPSGRWCKKIRGKLHYFGPWEDPQAAEALWNRQKADLLQGRQPADNPEGLTVHALCAAFLLAKKERRDSGELSPRTFADYGAACKRMVQSFGKDRLVIDLRPDDFGRLRGRWARTWGPHRLKREITLVRVVFNYAIKNALIERLPVFGDRFEKPSAKTLRKHRAARGPRMFEAAEIRRMIDAAGPGLRPMLFLGINCGFSNADCGALPMKALDLEGGWVNFAREKTGIMRRCPLWPETVRAIRESLAVRPQPKNPAHGDLVFLTSFGDSWAKDTSDNPISNEVGKLVKKLKLEGNRSFYALRHTLQTIGDEARDFLAVRSIMGHVGADIADHYRERMSDERLQAVAEHVRSWLYDDRR